MSDYTIICPCYWIDELLFEENLQSWLNNIPTHRVILGVNRAILYPFLEKMRDKYPVIELVDQTHLKTLGMCLADLMKIVDTEWFVYCHSDARLTPHAFLIMQQYQKEDVGIIESHREEWDGSTVKVWNCKEAIPKLSAKTYFFLDRSFSGIQLIQKVALEELINRMEDDYLYRNEDMIFHAEAHKNGYKYCKTWAMHIHIITNTQWSHNDEVTHMMQYRGFIKYTEPNDVTKINCLAGVKHMKATYNLTIASILEFCYIHSNAWAEVIAEYWDDLDTNEWVLRIHRGE